MQPESLIKELDRGRETLAAWDCPDGLLDELRVARARIVAEYGRLQERVRAVAEATRGALRTQVVAPLLEPIAEVDLGRALFLKSDLAEVRVAAADRDTPAYAALRELYPPMRRLVAEHLINTKRLRSALLKRFSALRAEVLAEEKDRLGRLYFDDIPGKLMALDGPASPDRPHFMARLYELGFHRTAHLLLDEFQDTSRSQFDLLRPLVEEILGSVGADAEGERSLFLVGDWKQSIYQWREAAPDYLRESIAPYLASGQLAAETLPHNYRSTPLLIGFFNHLVAELFAGTGKVNLQTPPATPKHPYSGISEVAVIPAACGAGDEAAYERLVEAIRDKRAACGCPWGDMAVLCRTNGHMDKVAAALAKAGIPTSGIRGRELLSLREGTALWLSLIALFTGHDGRFIPRSLASLGYGEELSAVVARSAVTMGSAPRPHRFAALRRRPARAGAPVPARPDRDALGRGGALLRPSRRRRCRRLPGLPACDVAPHHRPRGGARRPGETGHDPQHQGPRIPPCLSLLEGGARPGARDPPSRRRLPARPGQGRDRLSRHRPDRRRDGHRRGGARPARGKGRGDGQPPLCRRDPRREEPDDPPAGRQRVLPEGVQRTDAPRVPKTDPRRPSGPDSAGAATTVPRRRRPPTTRS